MFTEWENGPPSFETFATLCWPVMITISDTQCNLKYSVIFLFHNPTVSGCLANIFKQEWLHLIKRWFRSNTSISDNVQYTRWNINSAISA